MNETNMRAGFCLPWVLGGIVLPLCSQAQLPLDSLTQKVTYTGVIQVEGVSKDELFSRALAWFAKSFKSSKAAVGLSDRESGVLTSSPEVNFRAYITRKNGKVEDWGIVKCSIKVYCRDGRFKYVISDFVHELTPEFSSAACAGGELERPTTSCLWLNLWTSLKVHADESVKALVNSLSLGMQGLNSPEDDW